jgi:hypothetical protein
MSLRWISDGVSPRGRPAPGVAPPILAKSGRFRSCWRHHFASHGHALDDGARLQRRRLARLARSGRALTGALGLHLLARACRVNLGECWQILVVLAAPLAGDGDALDAGPRFSPRAQLHRRGPSAPSAGRRSLRWRNWRPRSASGHPTYSSEPRRERNGMARRGRPPRKATVHRSRIEIAAPGLGSSSILLPKPRRIASNSVASVPRPRRLNPRPRWRSGHSRRLCCVA